MRILLMVLMIAGLSACGPDDDESEFRPPPVNATDVVVDDSPMGDLSGTLSGHIDNGDDFFTQAEVVLSDDGRALRLFGSNDGQEVMALIMGAEPIAEMEPGEYNELTNDFFTRGCSGDIRGFWTFDGVGTEVTIIVDDLYGGTMVDYAIGLEDSGGFLTGSAGPF